MVKVKESRNRPGVVQRVPRGLGYRISWHSACEGGKVVSLTHRPPLPAEMFLVLIFTRGWVDPRAMVRSEGDMSLKNQVTLPGIDPWTFGLVAQRLIHKATPGPIYTRVIPFISLPVIPLHMFKQWAHPFTTQHTLSTQFYKATQLTTNTAQVNEAFNYTSNVQFVSVTDFSYALLFLWARFKIYVFSASSLVYLQNIQILAPVSSFCLQIGRVHGMISFLYVSAFQFLVKGFHGGWN